MKAKGIVKAHGEITPFDMETFRTNILMVSSGDSWICGYLKEDQDIVKRAFELAHKLID